MPIVIFGVVFAIIQTVRISFVLIALFARYVVPFIARMIFSLVTAVIRLARRWIKFCEVLP